MTMRKDALVCGAEIIQSVETIANGYHQDGIVATVGGINFSPNTMNAIARDVTLLIEIRGKIK
ncbi:hypothetical protein [Macrococcus animalis]|uniref:hypothetical protein n=1 Tax=Macrococcus animalis TaxID=3395467 RepID=UPI0039BE084A